MTKSILIFLTALSTIGNVAQARVVNNYTSAYPVDYTNVFFTSGYTLNYDQYFIDQCNSKINSTPTPQNQILYSKASNPYLIQRRQDPAGRGYYDDMKISCVVSFINPSADCTNSGSIYVTGETRLETKQNLIDCLNEKSTYTCKTTVWSLTKTDYVKIPGCIPK